MKRAGYYLLDITRCGKNYHLGYERWINFAHTQELIDRDWNCRFYTTILRAYDDISLAVDYRITRYSFTGFFYSTPLKKGLEKLYPKPYRLKVNNRTLITPR